MSEVPLYNVGHGAYMKPRLDNKRELQRYHCQQRVPDTLNLHHFATLTGRDKTNKHPFATLTGRGAYMKTRLGKKRELQGHYCQRRVPDTLTSNRSATLNGRDKLNTHPFAMLTGRGAYMKTRLSQKR